MKSSLCLSALLISVVATASHAQWTPVTYPESPEGFDQIEVLDADAHGLFAGSFRGLVYSTPDHGLTWDLVGTGLPIGEYSPSTAVKVVGDWMLLSRAVEPPFNYRSYFDGEAWGEWELLPYQDSHFDRIGEIGDALFAMQGGILHRTEDFGLTWEAVSLAETLTDFRVVGDAIVASTSIGGDGQLYRSSDLGETWESVPDLGSSFLLSGEDFQGESIVSVYHGAGVGALWSSPASSQVWEEVQSLPTTRSINGLVQFEGGFALGASGADGSGSSFWYSDDMVNWIDYTGDLPWFAKPFNELISHDGWFFKTGGTTTIYRAPHPDNPADVSSEGVLASSPALSMYPNPVRSNSVVRFQLEHDSAVRLSVHDASGRKVRSLVEGTLGSGEQSVEWNGNDDLGSRVAAGVYFLRLQTDSARSVQRAVVMD